jgi:chromosome segregation ATPase
MINFFFGKEHMCPGLRLARRNIADLQYEKWALEEKLASHDYAGDTATQTIMQLTRENEQLLDQLDEANQTMDVLRAQVKQLQEEKPKSSSRRKKAGS